MSGNKQDWKRVSQIENSIRNLIKKAPAQAHSSLIKDTIFLLDMVRVQGEQNDELREYIASKIVGSAVKRSQH